MNIKVILSRAENINHYNAEEVTLDIEEYLRGVVPAEIGNSALEACKAQAVAARTFALYKQIHLGQITDKSSKDQAFRASRISSSYPNAIKAVEETAGQVLYYDGKLCSTCVYSASNGGHVYSSQEVWGSIREYLVSKDDPYDTKTKNGHGVGMSQTGAVEMAKKGYSYKDILDFYYPGAEIQDNYGEKKEVILVAEKTKPEVVVEWAYSKLDPQCGYIWGSAGQIATESFIRAKVAQYPDHVDYDIVKRWLGKQVYDCQGFVRCAMKEVGIDMVSGATSQWNKTPFADKGTIDSLPYDKVCCLYRYDKEKNNMAHTGLYLGDGEHFIHAAGSKTGVVQSTLKAYGRWTHWGIPVGLYDDMKINISIEGLKRGDKGVNVSFLQTMLLRTGMSLPKYGADSDFGAETENAVKDFQSQNGLEVTGIIDAATEKLLYEKSGFQQSDSNVEVIKVAYQAKVTGTSGSTVNMRSGPGTNYAIVTTIRFGQLVNVTGIEGDWSAITWNDKSGYMQSKYLVKVDGSENKVWYVRIECDSEAQAKAVASILGKAKVAT